MKKIALLASFVIASLLTFAQQKFEEVVYLKNGSVIHGMIVEFIPNVSIKIKSGENLFAYKLDEIEKITREVSVASKNGFGYKSKGYVGIVEAGLTDFPSDAGYNLSMVTINIINGYQFNPYLFLGGGVGTDISANNLFKLYNVPVFADFRVNFTKTRVSPFFDVALGYNLQIAQVQDYNYYYSNVSTQVYHGLVFNPAFGARVAINKKLAVSLSLGYKMVGVNSTVTDYYGNSSSNFGLLHGLTLKAAFHF